MNFLTIPTAILAFLGIAAAAGAASVWYKRGQGESQLKTAQNIINMQIEENALLTRKNTALQTQLDIANNVISELANGKSNHSRKEK